MSEPIKCYAVTSGSHSNYMVLAIYRRREDAEDRVKTNNEAPKWFVSGKPVYEQKNLPCIDKHYSSRVDWSKVELNNARESFDDMLVEEFDYYEGESLPAAQELR